MHDPIAPISWQDIAAAYDARGLPFLKYFLESQAEVQTQTRVQTPAEHPIRSWPWSRRS